MEGQTEKQFDMPCDKITILSKVEGLTALSEAEGLSRTEGGGFEKGRSRRQKRIDFISP